jgi:glucose-6-phosphate isomerase
MLNDSHSLHFDPVTGEIAGLANAPKHLSQLRGCFADEAAYAAALVQSDPVLYRVASVEPATGPGQLHYGLGVLLPGRIGDEYYLTRGHLHTNRAAAEVYLGLRGMGLMLLEDEHTGECRAVALQAHSLVYVPGHTAHRTVNIGDEPLVYWGIYPSDAGHDYSFVAQRNFRQVVVARAGAPVVLERADYLKTLERPAA